MNEPYVQKNEIPINDTKQDRATEAVEKLIERKRQARERSKQILDYYMGLREKGMRT